MKQILTLLLAFLGIQMGVLAQNKTVSGRVIDASARPIAGASVVVKNTTIGTTTDANGDFRLSVPQNARTLVISSVGMATQEVAAGTGVVVTMQTAGEDLGTVVVTVPYGTVKKKAFTGAENTVTAKTLQNNPVTSITKALEGQVSGVVATNGGGAPGSNATIQIRGIGSINASSSPLYVLNGIPYDGSINSIPIDDVESVSVLKDAAAAALYGARAANGVIMITTKKGRAGAAKMTASVRQGFMTRAIPEYSRVGSKEYYELFWEAYRNQNLRTAGTSMAQAGILASNVLTGPNGLVYNAYNVPGNKLVDSVTGKLNPNASLLWNESFEDAMFRTASRTNANISVSGGGSGSDYYMSMGYINEEGIVKYSGLKRYMGRATFNATPKKWFTTGINVDAQYTNRQDVPSGGTATTNPFYYTRQMGPIYPVYQHNLTTGAIVIDSTTGEQMFDYGVPEQMGTRPYAGQSNVAGTLKLDDRSLGILNGNGNIYGEIKFLKDFSFKATFGSNLYDTRQTEYQNMLYGDAASSGGRSTKSAYRAISYTANQVLSWSRELGNHNVRALVGHENYKFKDFNLSGSKSQFLIPGMTELDAGGNVYTNPSSSVDNHRIESYFGNVNYDYKSKYLLSASYRTDGSSRFAPEVRWGNFYSVGAGWRIKGEDFLANNNNINELKLRASYGEQGNEDLGSLYYENRNYYWFDGAGAMNPITRVANPALQWEKNAIMNFGVDFAFLRNRVSGSLDWFNRKSNNLLFSVPLPISTGYLTQYQNVGSMSNKGLELQLSLGLVRKTNFNWKMDINLTHFKNEITELPKFTVKNGGIVSGTKKLAIGHSIYDYWLKEYAGVDAATGDALYYTFDSALGKKVTTNNWNSADYNFQGSAIPKISGGITNTFSFYGFELSVLTTFAKGGKFYDVNYASIMHTGSAGTAWHTDILNRWQKPGDITNVPRVEVGDPTSATGTASTRWLFDGSYFNIKNITLAYSFPKDLTNRLKISGAQFFVNTDNVMLFTAKKGADPQQSFSGVSDATYTPFRTTSVGFTVNF